MPEAHERHEMRQNSAYLHARTPTVVYKPNNPYGFLAQWYGAGVDSWLSRVRIPSQALLKKKYIKCQKQKMNHRGLPHTRGYERDLVISVNIPIRRLSAWGGGGHRCWCRMKSALSIKAQHRRGPAAASGRTSWHIRYCPCFEYLRCKIINLPSINPNNPNNPN